MSFTSQQLADCAALEVHWRRIVYPKRIAAGKMDHALADRQVALMEAIRDHFVAMAATDQPELMLEDRPPSIMVGLKPGELPDVDLPALFEEAQGGTGP